MRIAFVSCMFTRVFADQPVWDWIAAQRPDRLLLLGDSLYLDLQTPVRPQDMNDNDFAMHLHALYSELIAQPQFAALVRSMPPDTVNSIWDDHDFLWNDAQGAEVHPVHTGKVRLTTAFHEAFRTALAQRLAPGSFPAVYNDGRFWNPDQPTLTTPSLALQPDVWLHLSDGRTHRTRVWMNAESKRTMLGAVQRGRFTAVIEAVPEAVHLFASGSTVAGYERYARDRSWLTAMAARQRMLVLSGDIHRNQFDAFHSGGFPLHEATSSGAAVKDAVVVGTTRQNFGLLDIAADTVTVQLYSRNRRVDERVFARSTWLPV